MVEWTLRSFLFKKAFDIFIACSALHTFAHTRTAKMACQCQTQTQTQTETETGSASTERGIAREGNLVRFIDAPSGSSSAHAAPQTPNEASIPSMPSHMPLTFGPSASSSTVNPCASSMPSHIPLTFGPSAHPDPNVTLTSAMNRRRQWTGPQRPHDSSSDSGHNPTHNHAA